MGKHLNEKDKQELILDYQKGRYKLKELANKYKCSITTVHRVTSELPRYDKELISKVIDVETKLDNLPADERNFYRQYAQQFVAVQKQIAQGTPFVINHMLKKIKGLDQDETTFPDYNQIISTLTKAKNIIFPKENAQIEINNNNQQTNQNLTVKFIE